MTKHPRPRLATKSLLLVLFVALSQIAWAAKETVLHTFTDGNDGSFPSNLLVADTAGNLYGTAALGGIYNGPECHPSCGIVFELSPDSAGEWTETVLYSFQGGTDGIEPAGVVFGPDGNLYGTTVGGGINYSQDGCCGTVFKLTHNPDGSWSKSALYSFTGETDGADPFAPLVIDSAGNLYGTTEGGGGTQNATDCNNGCGVVYELSPSSSGSYTYSLLYGFTGGADGAQPIGSLILDATGNFYGTTWLGGTTNAPNCNNGCGVVFKLAPSGGKWNFSVLHSFSGGNDGANPMTALVLDTAGNLYGSTIILGANGGGVVYRLSQKEEWKDTVLQSFNSSGPGATGPSSSLVFDSAGNLFGVAGGGMKGEGSVFMLSPRSGTWKLTTLYGGFNYALGELPTGSVLLGPGGAMYGTTSEGGEKTEFCIHGCGVVYQISR
ncbi:MAG: choice-of-anchor tandem repeat GloVer-containing protein [Candidatus Sulfotelmatobacter sp.]